MMTMMTKFEPVLDKLMKQHERIQKLSNDILQKEKDICALMQKLIDEEYKLGNVCKFKAGKFNTKNMSGQGKYPFYNASINNPIGFHNDYCF